MSFLPKRSRPINPPSGQPVPGQPVNLDEEVGRLAHQLTELVGENKSRFDYSMASLAELDLFLEGAAQGYKQGKFNENQISSVSQLAGAYIFEVFRRTYGGTYQWYAEQNQPLLVVGEPEFRVSFLAMQKARGRIVNGSEDNIPFYADGIVERIAAKKTAHII